MYHADRRTEGETGGQSGWHARTQAGRRRDMTKLTVAFRNFANAPENTVELLITDTAGEFKFCPL
jgi:hypothetical protein